MGTDTDLRHRTLEQTARVRKLADRIRAALAQDRQDAPDHPLPGAAPLQQTRDSGSDIPHSPSAPGSASSLFALVETKQREWRATHPLPPIPFWKVALEAVAIVLCSFFVLFIYLAYNMGWLDFITAVRDYRGG